MLSIDYTATDPRLAYARLGHGDRPPLLYLPGLFIPVAKMDEDPGCARFLEGLASFGSLVVLDPRGIGYADPIPDWETPIFDQWADDVERLLAEFGSGTCSIISTLTSSMLAVRVAHRLPDLVERLVFINGVARPPDEAAAEALETIRAGRDDPFDWPGRVAPSRGHDPAFRRWWTSAGQQGASPGVATRIWSSVFTEDTRAILPELDIPSLVVHRLHNHLIPRQLCRELAEGLPNATYVEQEGPDAVEFAGDIDGLVAVIAEFLTGAPLRLSAARQTATILVTDIVGSTTLAQAAGPQAWKGMLDHHDRIVAQEVSRRGGTVVKFTGDGALAVFDSPSRALVVAHRLVDELSISGLPIRAGVHLGELDLRGADVSGIAVHVASRVSDLAGSGEVLCSPSVPIASIDADFHFDPVGRHVLRGVEGEWELYRSAPPR